mgnify:CR=1 FL=1
MDKIKKLRETIGRHKYTITIVGFLLIICFLDQNNLLLRLRHQRQIRKLKSEIEYYTTLRDQSLKGLKELENDSNNLERIAREKYGMHLPNEEVFIIEE